MIKFIAGIVIGSIIGFFICACLSVGGRDE